LSHLTLSAMFKIRRLYTEPSSIDPIEFQDGINIILGERDETSEKTNGVGKSLCVEFINFALLKGRNSRVSKIPKSAFDPDTNICLDIEINSQQYTIKRSVANAEQPSISGIAGARRFEKIDDATTYLTDLVFSGASIPPPNFRVVMGPLMRDERSEFKSLIACYDTRLRAPDNYEPHLYFFGLDISLYNDAREAITQYGELTKEQNKIKQNIESIRGLSIKDARSELNELIRQVKRIEESIDELETTPSFDAVKDDMLAIEASMEEVRRTRDIARRRLRHLAPILRPVDIDVNEVKEFYSQIQSRLGDIVQKDLSEVIEFKKRIDDFQNRLLLEQRTATSQTIKAATERLRKLDERYRKFLTVLDQEGNLRSLKQTYAAFNEKSDELGQLKSFVSRYDQLETDKQRARSERETRLLALQSMITGASERIRKFEQYVLDMHEFIQGNRKASFDIEIATGKQVVQFEMRIDDDGSYSVEREKVFIYDISLLLSEATRHQHIGYLLHDNIFGDGDDTLRRSLQFLYERGDFSGGQQYIITFNEDQLAPVTAGNELADEIREDVRATFTKANRFLKTQYQEI
jgi:uncharacterized protein YydD (DUF2326 family)